MTAPIPRLAEVSDLTAWPGVVVEDAQRESAEAVLDAVSDYLRVESGDPDRWLDPSSAPRMVKRLVVQVAARIWTNPTGAVQTTAGPFSESFRQDVEAGLDLTDSERATLNRLVGRTGLWTLRTERDGRHLVNGVYDRFSGVTVPSTPYPHGQVSEWPR